MATKASKPKEIVIRGPYKAGGKAVAIIAGVGMGGHRAALCAYVVMPDTQGFIKNRKTGLTGAVFSL